MRGLLGQIPFSIFSFTFLPFGINPFTLIHRPVAWTVYPIPVHARGASQQAECLFEFGGLRFASAIARGNQRPLPARSEEPMHSGQSAWVLDAEDSTLTITPWGQIES